MSRPCFVVHRLAPGDLGLVRQLNALFAVAFDEKGTYEDAPPDDAYVERLLANDHNVVLVATDGEPVVGGLVAYQLDKFEQPHPEIYLYDLAVALAHRRRGIATALIGALRDIAAARGAYVIYVQADLEDAPAIALYTRLGTREDVLHFDIPLA